MADPRDELDAWLSEPIQPLTPPAGAFEQIRRRARRRKARRAALSTLAAAAVVAIVAAVPPVVIGRLLPKPSSAPPFHRPTATATRTPSPSPSASRTRRRTAARIPSGFHPASVTFVGTNTGWVLGYARFPGCAGGVSACDAIARTDSYGASWQPVKGPAAAAPQGDFGASQIRFLGTRDGWVFGPGLWATHNGGRTWRAIPTGRWRVIGLEAVGDRAFAVMARCTGSGADYASNCTSFSVYTSSASSDLWGAVGGGLAPAPAGARGSAQLLMTNSRAYLLAPGRLLSGPISDQGWQEVAGRQAGQPLPCDPGLALPDGQPSGAMLASNSSGLVLLCLSPPTTGGAQQKVLYRSADGGRTWRQVGAAPASGTALSLAGTSSQTLILATNAGIERSTNDGRTWQASQPAGGAFPPGGFSYVGMTFPLLGVALPADPASHTLWFTHDGGITWQPSRIP